MPEFSSTVYHTISIIPCRIKRNRDIEYLYLNHCVARECCKSASHWLTAAPEQLNTDNRWVWCRPRLSAHMIAVVFQMQAITADTVIAYITHENQPQNHLRQASTERSDVVSCFPKYFCFTASVSRLLHDTCAGCSLIITDITFGTIHGLILLLPCPGISSFALLSFVKMEYYWKPNICHVEERRDSNVPRVKPSQAMHETVGWFSRQWSSHAVRQRTEQVETTYTQTHKHTMTTPPAARITDFSNVMFTCACSLMLNNNATTAAAAPV